MTRKYVYIILAMIGFIAPYYFLISFLLAHGFDLQLLIQQLFGTPISSFFAVDLIVSSIVFIVYLSQEEGIKRKWVYLIALFAVGLSLALPLFLFARAGQLESKPK